MDYLVDVHAPFVVGLTAMVPPSSESLERKLLQEHEFQILDSAIKTTVDIFSPQQLPTQASIAHFILNHQQHAKVIVCNDNEECIKNKYAGCNVLVNPSDRDRIEKLTKKDIVFLTKEQMLRGFNFRLLSPFTSLGIALLLCKTMSSDRALKQCLGRVGRGGE